VGPSFSLQDIWEEMPIVGNLSVYIYADRDFTTEVELLENGTMKVHPKKVHFFCG
jgi:hypothetical protein